MLLTFYTFVYKYCLRFYDELCIFGQPRACLIFIFIQKVFNCLHKLSMTFKYNYPVARV